jgi:2-dehydro-3-deoxyphosphooctonate aldolase (KDO 8-P synthase)
MTTVRVGDALFGGDSLAVIAGPCVIEAPGLTLEVAAEMARATRDLGLPYVFKASYAKANRSSVRSHTGPGLEAGLAVLADVRRRIGVPVLSDVHEAEEIDRAAEVLDVLQIPAFLCRQTALLVKAGATGLPVNVKKGQFLAPDDAPFVVEKIESTGNRKILLTERGTTFGYHNLVVDMRAIPILKRTGYPVVFDVTHSLQLPGGERTGGMREHAATLARAAVAAGADAVFLETHPDPSKALSDASTALPLAAVPALLRDLARLRETVRSLGAAPDAPR